MEITCDNYIGSKLISGSASNYTPVYNPSRGEVIAQAPESDARTVDQAVQTAKKAFPAWAETRWSNARA
jgi:malonate-semialdehyde dehydrogenase (acetylating) / methylmalonate-semialdehyde dehydrogenase